MEAAVSNGNELAACHAVVGTCSGLHVTVVQGHHVLPVVCVQMRGSCLTLGEPFLDLRESIRIFFVRLVQDKATIHEVRTACALHDDWQ